MAKAKGLYKRGKTWWIRYAGLDGRIRYESTQSSSFKVARDLLTCRRKEVMEGKDPIITKRIGNHLFKELAEHYLEWAQKQKSFRGKKYFVRALAEKFKNYPLRRFNTKLVERLQTEILTNGKSNATANRYLATLKYMFTKAVEWEMVEGEVLKKVRRVKLFPEKNRLRFLSKNECHDLIEACIPYLKPIAITALNTGMRKEEILSLEWEKHVDLKHGLILLDETKNGERREIPINSVLRETLQGLIRHIDSPYVFTNGGGKRFKDIKRSFKSALRKAGIKDFTFHDLRHTFASQLVMAGVDIATIKELLGHKTLSMTLRYAHLSKGHKHRAVSILEEALSQDQLYKNYTIGANSIKKELTNAGSLLDF